MRIDLALDGDFDGDAVIFALHSMLDCMGFDDRTFVSLMMSVWVSLEDLVTAFVCVSCDCGGDGGSVKCNMQHNDIHETPMIVKLRCSSNHEP